MGRPDRTLTSAKDGLTVMQAAEKIGVHHQTIRNWIRKETLTPGTGLPVTRFGPSGGILRIHPDDLEEQVDVA